MDAAIDAKAAGTTLKLDNHPEESKKGAE